MADVSQAIEPRAFVAEDEIERSATGSLLIILHGMRDDGFWRHVLQAEADRTGGGRLVVEAVNYGRLDTLAFLTGSRGRLIEEYVLSRIGAITERHPDAELFFFAHSYGTHILARIVPRVDRAVVGVFLAGAICHPLDAALFDRVECFIANECGIDDVWPLLAATVKPSTYGPVGVCGFNGAPIVDRFFRYGHSGALTEDHFRDWVLPAIVTRRLRRSKPIDPAWRKHVPVYARRALLAITTVVLASFALGRSL